MESSKASIVPLGIEDAGSYKIIFELKTLGLVQAHLKHTFKSPDMFAPACIPVTEGKNMENTEKNV